MSLIERMNKFGNLLIETELLKKDFKLSTIDDVMERVKADDLDWLTALELAQQMEKEND